MTYRTFFAGRTVLKRYGNHWTVYARWGRAMFELNLGWDRRSR